ncbi:MAG: FHA domain-containing protein [Leptospirales bacterium]|nr:FHA domain-containing protein [Leptospirales bacterium]
MKLFIQTTFLLTLFVFTCRPFLASAPVKIQNIDTSNFPKIHIEVTGLVQGLNESDFFIYEDGYRANYVKITPSDKNSTGVSSAISVVFCLDSSKSIKDPFLKELKKSALDISANLALSDIAIYGFDDNVVLLNDFSRDKQVINASINSVYLRGSKTMLYDAVYKAMSRIESGPKNGIVVVFTDGKDEGSSVTVQDISALSRAAKIPVFFVSKKSYEIKTMNRIAKLTGGSLVFIGNEASILRSVSSRFKGEYDISYHSLLKPDGKEHKLEVRLSSGQSDSSVFYLDGRGAFFANLLNFFNKENLYKCGPLFLFLLIILLILLIALIFIVRRKSAPRTVLQTMSQAEKEIAPSAVKVTVSDDAEIVEYVPMTMGQGYANAWFIRKNGDEADKKIHIHGKEVTIGRSKECNIVIHDNRVSAFHAKVKNAGGIFYLFDLVSDHGTYLNGSKLLRPKPLYDWDEISLGRITLIFRGSKIID